MGLSQADHERDVPADRVVEIAVNLDDVSAEVVGDAQRALLDAGALDVWTVAIGMKKQRPGVMLCVLCEEAAREALARRVLELTGSFGLRHRVWERTVLARRFGEVDTAWGTVAVKLGYLEGRLVSARAEYESARAVAASSGALVREVIAAAEAAAQQRDWPEEASG